MLFCRTCGAAIGMDRSHKCEGFKKKPAKTTPLDLDIVNQIAIAEAERLSDRKRIVVRQMVKRIISAYLAAAQPVVTSVEELDALPIGSIVQDLLEGWSHRKDTPTTWLGFGDENGFLAHDILLPARVLYRPEANDA